MQEKVGFSLGRRPRNSWRTRQNQTSTKNKIRFKQKDVLGFFRDEKHEANANAIKSVVLAHAGGLDSKSSRAHAGGPQRNRRGIARGVRNEIAEGSRGGSETKSKAHAKGFDSK